jgi:hypothetical protein
VADDRAGLAGASLILVSGSWLAVPQGWGSFGALRSAEIPQGRLARAREASGHPGGGAAPKSPGVSTGKSENGALNPRVD